MKFVINTNVLKDVFKNVLKKNLAVNFASDVVTNLSTTLSTSLSIKSALFLLGCCSVLLVRTLPSTNTLLLISISFCLISIRYRLARTLAIMLLGATWMTFVASQSLNDQLSVHYEKKRVNLLINVVDFPQGDDSYRVFTAVAIQSTYNDEIVLKPNSKIRLSCYHCDVKFELGDQWQVEAILRRPRGLQSWGAFDFEKYALSQRISATGYIKKVNEEIAEPKVKIFQILLFKIRKKIQLSLQAIIPNKTSLAIISALSIGDRSAFTPEIWRILRAAGLSHLVSISGLHIGLIFFISRFLIRKITNVIYPIYYLLPAIYIESFLALLCSAAYAALAGFSVPTQRALIMIMIYFLSIFSPRSISLISILCLTIVGILFLDPLVILNSSFWLSVTAVVLIAGVQLTKKRSAVYFQSFLSLAMIPLTIAFFSEFSLVSPVINLIAVPLVSFVILPFLMVGLALLVLSPNIGEMLLSFLATSVQLLWDSLLWMENVVPTFSISMDFDVFEYILSACVIGLFILWSLLPNKILIMIVFACAFIVSKLNKDTLENGEFILTVLDVGQGLAIVIETQKGVSIFDAGVRYGESDSSQKIIIPYLNRLGADELQSLLISHSDADHMGGLNSLIKQYPVARFLTSENIAIDNNNEWFVEQTLCHHGIAWQESGVTFRILAPIFPVNETLNRNNRSCVLLIESPLGSALLPGDIERKTEHQLIQHWGDKMTADVLILAHHGSITSSSPAFLQRVNPKIAVASSAYLSKHGHPHSKVVSRVRRLGVKLINTADSGSVQIAFRNTGMKTIEYRAMRQRFWYAID